MASIERSALPGCLRRDTYQEFPQEPLKPVSSHRTLHNVICDDSVESQDGQDRGAEYPTDGASRYAGDSRPVDSCGNPQIGGRNSVEKDTHVAALAEEVTTV